MVTLTQVNVTTDKNMKYIKEEELQNIVGGAAIATLMNAITKSINTVYQLGKQTGSALRRLVNGNYCPIR